VDDASMGFSPITYSPTLKPSPSAAASSPKRSEAVEAPDSEEMRTKATAGLGGQGNRIAAVVVSCYWLGN